MAGILTALVAFGAMADSESLPSLSGRVHDVLGNVIADVEVLIVAPARGVEPVAVARSDKAGRFQVAGLQPGIYRVAALKQGHPTFVGEINTDLQSWIDVILRPQPAGGDPSAALLPSSPAWSLRLPRRGVLRDIELPVEGAEVELGVPEDGLQTLLGEDLRLQVEQLFALRQGLGGAGDYRPGGQGQQTRLQVASLIGERAFVELRGSRERFDATHSSADLTESATQGASSMALDISYAAGADSRFALKAYYDRRDLGIATKAPATALSDLRQERRTWGYDAAWSAQIDATSSVAVELDYRDTTFDLPGALRDHGQTAGTETALELRNRTIGAVGTYENLSSVDHRVQVGLQARVVDNPLLLQPLHQSFPQAVDGEEVFGLSLGLEAQDTWRVSGPLSLVGGLRYQQNPVLGSDSLIVPRVGGTWSVDEGVLSFAVSYHQEASWGLSRPLQRAGEDPDSTRLGYEISLEMPLARGVRFTGSSRFAPIQIDGLDLAHDPPRPGAGQSYLTNGRASVRESRLALMRQGARTSTWVEWVRGRAEGALAPLSPYEQPYLLLAMNTLDYQNGRFGIRIAGSGTDLVLDHSRIREWPGEAVGVDPSAVQSSLGLSISQDLLRLHSFGNWRLLVSLRTASFERRNDSGGLDLTGQDRLFGASNREMSAGLSVLF
jgi:hypothetical protein